MTENVSMTGPFPLLQLYKSYTAIHQDDKEPFLHLPNRFHNPPTPCPISKKPDSRCAQPDNPALLSCREGTDFIQSSDILVVRWFGPSGKKDTPGRTQLILRDSPMCSAKCPRRRRLHRSKR